MNRRLFFKSSVAAAVALSFQHNLIRAALAHGGTTVKGDVYAKTGDGDDVVLPKAAVQDLADSLRGHLILPGGAGYDKARLVLNADINKFPALVVQPEGAADVETVVQFARQENLLTAVKCGGHAFSGLSTCNGGMQIDLSRMRHVRVDPVRQRAWVAGGSLLGEMDFETMAHGLVTTAGSVSHTGVGGLTLGGGFGRLARKYGLSCDNVLSVDIVTADGQLRRASADENPDLYWAVRGGGGNFGVVTDFEFQLHEQDREVLAGRYMFPVEKRAEVLRFLNDFGAEAPDELQVAAFMGAFPGSDPVTVLGIVYSGDHDKAEGLLAPIEKLGPVANTVKTWDYVALQKSGDMDDPRANGSYMKSGFVDSITDDMIEDLLDSFRGDPGRDTWCAFGHCGGAINRVPYGSTAFTERDAGHEFFSFVGWPAGTDGSEHLAYLSEQWAQVGPHTRGFYVNDLGDETQADIDANYGANLERLVQVKNTYDPTNLFRLNANIKPTV